MSRSLVIGVGTGLLSLVAFGLWWERRQRLAAQAEWRRVLPVPPPLVALTSLPVEDAAPSEREPMSAAEPQLSAQPTEAAPRPFSIDDAEAGAPEDLGLTFLRGATESDGASEEPDFYGFHVQESP